MKLSILDQSPVPEGKTAGEALMASAELAKEGEKAGYKRFWVTEHHDLPGLACSSPEVLLSYIGAQTNTIRIGAGAVLLPHYKPYKTAENFNMLANLFPGRIDLGIGRAPGGSAEVTMALSDNYLEEVRKFPDSVDELTRFIYKGFPQDHMFSKISAAPVPAHPPGVWLLGTSGKSADLAAEHGLAYAFGQFMSEKDGSDIIERYKNNFQGTSHRPEPETILTVSAICAATEEKAEELALSSLLWKFQSDNPKTAGGGIPSLEEARSRTYSEKEKESIENGKKRMIIGDPLQVSDKLKEIKETTGADEIMVNTITHSFEDRINSYRLIAKALID